MCTATQEPCLCFANAFKTHDTPFLKPMFCHVSSFNLILCRMFSNLQKPISLQKKLNGSQCFFVDLPHTETRSAGDDFDIFITLREVIFAKFSEFSGQFAKISSRSVHSRKLILAKKNLKIDRLAKIHF